LNDISFDRGMKRSCLSCEARFYDLGRSPAICPKCGVECADIVRVVSPSYRARKGFGRGRPLPVEEQEGGQPEAVQEGEEKEEGEDGEESEREPDDEPEAEADAEEAE
jgi:uncharacterized protein (TIGR02300 family)